MARQIALWATGLFAFSAIGSGVGMWIAPYGIAPLWGMLAGLCLFACIRLWWTESRAAPSN